MNRYRVERKVTITVIDHVMSPNNITLAGTLYNGPSLAAEISSLGLATTHQNVAYTDQDVHVVLEAMNLPENEDD
jgi:hypothetical protein